MRALGFEPKKEEIKKMIASIDKEGNGECCVFTVWKATVFKKLHYIFFILNGFAYMYEI